MLSQNDKRKTPYQAPSSPLRDDHLVLLAIDAALAAHTAVKRWLERRRTRRALAALDDRLLCDIGVTRPQALRESSRWWSGRDKCHRALVELDDSHLSKLSENGLRVRRAARQAGHRA